MEATANIVDLLGGPGILDDSTSSPESLRQRIRDGLPYTALETLMQKLGLRREEISVTLALPLRTFSRRRQERRLRPDESDRLFRLARIAARAVEIIGSEEKVSLWLHRSNRALGSQTPLSLLDTDLGACQVEQVLGRIEHGVYS